MSIIDPSLARQKFYRSMAVPCPYLPGRMESKLFTRLDEGHDAALNSMLTRAGFRRSHNIAYRPVCDACRACTPVRVVVNEFAASSSQARVLRRNLDLACVLQPAIATREQFALFTRYQQGRHSGGDMSLMRWDDYAAMVEEGTSATGVFEWRDAEGRLKAAMLADGVADGLSAVYSFFDPDDDRRSLGTFMILSLIGQAATHGREYLYLGYTIDGMAKMEYKSRFRPLEVFGDQGWRLLPNH
jgi:arginine-tRNA-protein transferase